jgi:hypothetical protein
LRLSTRDGRTPGRRAIGAPRRARAGNICARPAAAAVAVWTTPPLARPTSASSTASRVAGGRGWTMAMMMGGGGDTLVDTMANMTHTVIGGVPVGEGCRPPRNGRRKMTFASTE